MAVEQRGKFTGAELQKLHLKCKMCRFAMRMPALKQPVHGLSRETSGVHGCPMDLAAESNPSSGRTNPTILRRPPTGNRNWTKRARGSMRSRGQCNRGLGEIWQGDGCAQKLAARSNTIMDHPVQRKVDCRYGRRGT